MEVLLHKGCGRPESRTMTLRPAGPEDAAAFYALQNEVRAMVAAEILPKFISIPHFLILFKVSDAVVGHLHLFF